VPVNSTHSQYDEFLSSWLRARDVIAGEDAVKTAGVRYLPRMESQSEEEYAAYKERASFFNATARTADGFSGLIFRRPPFLKLPEGDSALSKALSDFKNDADMLGTPLIDYAKRVIDEVIAVGRAGTLIDWQDEAEDRAYVSAYSAENILNWRVERINGRNVPTMVVLFEPTGGKLGVGKADDPFQVSAGEQIRVLKLIEVQTDSEARAEARPPKTEFQYAVELWQPEAKNDKGEKDWKLIETKVPLRLGKPLPIIPFVFHGPRHSRPDVEKLPLADIIAVNLDHYRLDADYKHGVHFTALPTAWVSGFDKTATLRIGSSVAWVAEATGATAGFLEFTGQGLSTFERAMDRDEKLLAVLGSRLLESQKKVGETAQAIELRQSGENSILSNLATSVSASLTQVLRWVYWWNSTDPSPEHVTGKQVLMQLNTDFSMKGMSAQEITAVVAAWQAGAISRDTMTDLFRRGEVLPEGRTTEEEQRLIGAEDGSAGR
jgi:hypothetical protein